MHDRENRTPQIDAALAVRRLAHALVAHERPTPCSSASPKRPIGGWRKSSNSHAWCAAPMRYATIGRAARRPTERRSYISIAVRCRARPTPWRPISSALASATKCAAKSSSGPACEGPPGHAHGGIIAALFDDATAFLTRLLDETCVASELTVHYRRPVPIGRPLHIEARVTRRDGRRIYTEATMHDGDTTVARRDVYQGDHRVMTTATYARR